jgi:hypothetical protein
LAGRYLREGEGVARESRDCAACGSLSREEIRKGKNAYFSIAKEE